jgi:peptide/nickel transport system substrate-binding protein
MRSRLGVRLAQFIAIGVIAAAGLMPSVATAQTDELVLNVGTDQKLRVLNPWFSITVADYEIFQIQYELLVSFDINLQPTEGFADEWSSSDDGLTHTFHIREGMLWSDGEPATCADVEYTFNFVLEAVASDRGFVGSGYLEPYLTNTGLESVECSADDLTLTAHTSHPSTLLTQAYIPILPEHIWSQYSMDEIGRRNDPNHFANDQFPVVGSGPYVATSWERGSLIRMERNDNYWGTPGVPDALQFQVFTGADTLDQALRAGEIDYTGGLTADLFDALQGVENIQTAEGFSNGYTYLSFNTRATQPGYNGSTSALEDQAFRDALGYAIDRQALVDRVLNGHGVPGTTHVPPYHVNWHVEPDNPREFNLDTANQKLDAAGYTRGPDGRRVDKEGNPIELRLTWPDSEESSSTDAQFIQGWFEEVGVGVDAFVTEEGKLLDDLLGPEYGDQYKADWDFYIWGWVGDPDPTSLLSLFTTDQIAAGINDSFYSDPRYDELFQEQLEATTEEARLAAIDEMQQLYYDAATYHILYYDSTLHAMRTDKFTNWTNQPPVGGTPIFGYGYPGYLALQDATAQPSPGPAETTAPGTSAGPATPAPSGAPTGGTGGDSTPLILGAIALIAVIAAGFWFMRRRGAGVEEE